MFSKITIQVGRLPLLSYKTEVQECPSLNYRLEIGTKRDSLKGAGTSEQLKKKKNQAIQRLLEPRSD